MQRKANPRSERGVQRAVLALALDANPTSLTVSHLAQEIGSGDAVERAVAELTKVGLLNRDGDRIKPSSGSASFRASGVAVSIAEQFGDNFRRQRKLASLSQDEVAYRVSIHRTEVSQLERGLRCPRADTIVKLAGALEIEPGLLFEGIAWEPGGVTYGRFSS